MNIEKEYSQAEKAYEILENMIVSLELEPGQIITENEISKKLNIGRMPIREALKKLESVNMVVILPRKGIMVKEITVEEMLQQLEVRRVLEKLIVERATKFMNEEEKKRLLEIADAFEKATIEKNALDSVQYDGMFNSLISKASRNPYAANAITPLHVSARRFYYFNYHIDEELTKLINMAHIELIRIMVTGDVEKALKQLKVLFECTKRSTDLRLNLFLN
ncbi:GntR family transcriptional regulator [Gottfriedia solisilvae]|uniref:GntR family transcriptional regulator n=1 Tax=Gottfriedia solisilvae TaxID=1516104 RepID=A0A8J3EW79_9BACI|nr:GntR family transcriptional regulator [Gottfriedia solisilvae]GGI11214.1 GntR family transcriptional regulator [Gottfriedia solisilvae]